MISHEEISKKWLEPTNRQSIEIELAFYLYNFIVSNNIKVMIETGVCQGFSSWLFLKALKETGGVLFSIEPNLYKKAQMVVPQELYPNWVLINAKSDEVLSGLTKNLKNIDFFWHDSDHGFDCQIFEFEMMYKHTKYLGAHNTDCSNAWKVFNENHKTKSILEKKFNRNWMGLVECLN